MESSFSILELLQHYHLLGMFLLLLACGFGMPVPEDIILITGGFVANKEHNDLWPSFAVAYLGVIIGDSIMYALGRKLGVKLLDSPRLKLIFPPSRRARVERIFQRWGAWAVLGGRFAAGVRAAVFVTAGAMRVPYRVFFLCDTVAALASVPLFIYLGYQFSEHLEEIFAFIGRAKLVVAAVVLVLLLAYLVYRWLRKKKAIQPPESPTPLA